MKRRKLIDHLARHGCILEREGARHSIFRNKISGKRSSVPRHNEIKNALVRKICKDLGIPSPED